MLLVAFGKTGPDSDGQKDGHAMNYRKLISRGLFSCSETSVLMKNRIILFDEKHHCHHHQQLAINSIPQKMLATGLGVTLPGLIGNRGSIKKTAYFTFFIQGAMRQL